MAMKIFVRVKPKVKKEFMRREGENKFVAAVRAAPEGGKANEAVARVLAKHFGVRRAQVRLVSGRASRLKLFEIA